MNSLSAILIVSAVVVGTVTANPSCSIGFCSEDSDCPATSYCMKNKPAANDSCWCCHAATPTIGITGISGKVEMPMAGLGTWLYNSTLAEASTSLALKYGYYLVDTALGYKNQDGIGRALKASGRSRSSYFITSKIPGGLNADDTKAALDTGLAQLELDFVDLMLLHFPSDWAQKNTGKAQRQEQWLALESWAKSGKARAIGVSHYCKRHIQDVLEVATVPIAVNQVQYHVGMGMSGPNATDDKEFDLANGIVYQSFSPLCGPCGTSALIDGPLVTKIGARHNKTGAQVSLKWQIQQNVPIIPKTHKVSHMEENIDMFSWDLTEEEMKTLTNAAKPPVAGDGHGNSGDCAVP